MFRRFRVLTTIFALTFTLILCSTSNASVIYSTFGGVVGDEITGSTETYDSSIGWSVHDLPDSLAYQAVAASFTPSANYTLSFVSVAIFNNTKDAAGAGDTGFISASIITDIAGSPTVLASLTHALSPDFNEIDFFDFSSLVLALNAGDEYWVMLNASTGSSFGWFFNDQNITGPLAGSFSAGGAFVINQAFTLPAFAVEGTPGQTPVPEPALMLLLGSGLIGLAALRRKF